MVCYSTQVSFNCCHILFLHSLFNFKCLFYVKRSFLSGHGTDYLNLALRDGGVSLTMGLSNGKQEMHIKPAKIRFDDHQWHKVTIHRRIQEISSITSFCRVSFSFSFI